MHLAISTLVATALAALASAGTIEFRNLDPKTRNIIFTPQVGMPAIASITLSQSEPTKVVQMPHGWIGNCYAIVDGAPDVPGMLGEFAFDGWQNLNYYDVSAIVNPTDVDGIKQIWPKDEQPHSGSGCTSYKTTCDNAYNLPDDIQTKSSSTGDFICTVGTAPSKKRHHARDFARAQEPATEERRLYPRDFVLGTVAATTDSQ
jgi:hypothetical protein